MSDPSIAQPDSTCNQPDNAVGQVKSIPSSDLQQDLVDKSTQADQSNADSSTHEVEGEDAPKEDDEIAYPPRFRPKGRPAPPTGGRKK